jgi:plasmid stabilization system protein ParE
MTKAEKDLEEIANYYDSIGKGDEILTQIFAEMQELADTPLISGSKEAGLGDQFRRWTILANRFYVYYRRTNKKTVLRVYRIYNTKRRPLKPSEILP